MAHYNHEWLHQGIGSERIERVVGLRSKSLKRVVSYKRLGGPLRSYRVSAAWWDTSRCSAVCITIILGQLKAASW